MTPQTTATPTSAAITVVVAGVAIASLGELIDGLAVPVAIGAIGALCLAVGISLATVAGRPAVAGASLLVVPGGGAVAVALILTAVSIGGTVFPIPDASLVSLSVLLIVGHVGVVLGTTAAALGVGLGVSSALGGRSLRRFSRIGFLTAVGPALLAGALTVRALGTSETPAGAAELPLSKLASLAVDPGGARLAAWSFLLALAAAAAGVWVALAASPIRELLDGRVTAESQSGRRLDRAETALWVGAVGVAAAAAVVGAIEFALSPDAIRDAIGPGSYAALSGITTAGGLRRLLFGVAAGGAIVGGLAWLGRGALRRGARSAVPGLVGAAIALVAVAVAEPAYAAVVEETVGRLPGPIRPRWREAAEQNAAIYGEAPLVLWLIVGLIAVAVGTSLALRGVGRLGYLRGEAAGYALGGGGLFLAAAFAGTIAAPAWLVFAGVLASLVVWDLGRFGTELRMEAAGAKTRRLELLHAGATIGVGLVGAGLAAGIGAVVDGLGPGTPTTLALLFAVAGLVGLVAALR